MNFNFIQKNYIYTIEFVCLFLLVIKGNPNGTFNFNKSNITTNTHCTQCQICQPGSYANQSLFECACCTNKKKEGQCEPHSSFIIGCQPCLPGYYQTMAGQIECLPCKPGHFSPIFGTKECELCPSGHFSKFSGSYTCLPCPVEYFCKEGCSKPQHCFENEFCPRGSSGPQYCGSPWFYKSETVCRLSKSSIATIALAIIVPVLILLIVLYRNRRRRLYLPAAWRTEQNPLLTHLPEHYNGL